MNNDEEKAFSLKKTLLTDPDDTMALFQRIQNNRCLSEKVTILFDKCMRKVTHLAVNLSLSCR
jgi:hypothetical protein